MGRVYELGRLSRDVFHHALGRLAYRRMADNTQSDFRQHGRRGRLIKPETFRGSPSSALDWLDKGLANPSASLDTYALQS